MCNELLTLQDASYRSWMSAGRAQKAQRGSEEEEEEKEVD